MSGVSMNGKRIAGFGVTGAFTAGATTVPDAGGV